MERAGNHVGAGGRGQTRPAARKAARALRRRARARERAGARRGCAAARSSISASLRATAGTRVGTQRDQPIACRCERLERDVNLRQPHPAARLRLRRRPEQVAMHDLVAHRPGLLAPASASAVRGTPRSPPRIWSTSPSQARWMSPASSTNRAPAIPAASSRPARTVMARSRRRCRTRVGDRTDGRIAETSVAYIASSSRAAISDDAPSR